MTKKKEKEGISDSLKFVLTIACVGIFFLGEFAILPIWHQWIEDLSEDAGLDNAQYEYETQEPINLTCPACPACECKASASCEPEVKLVEACHIPDRYFSMPSKNYEYTGLSNIPSFFMGNKIEVVKVESEKDLFVGCHYGFIDGEIMKVHRLLAVYDDYLVFRGDNSPGTEEVSFDAVQFLVRSVDFK